MKKRKRSSSGRRDVFTSSLSSLPSRVSPSFYKPIRQRVRSPLAGLAVIQDRRVFHPERAARPALSFSGNPSRLALVDRPASKRARAKGFRFQPMQTKALIAFAEPDRVLVCVRRHVRKEVLLALGKGGSGGRKPRRNWTSSISCRRS